MRFPIRKSVTILFLFLLLPGAVQASLMGQISHFPTTSGSSWTYAGSGLTLNSSGTQVTMPFVETVTANGGVFHSEIAFSNGNTTTSDNVCFQGDALYIASTRIVIFTSVTSPYSAQTTTTSNNSYSPPQEWFPSELYAGNVETSSGSCTTNITTTGVVMGYPIPPTTASKITSETIRINVAGEETVTVGAGIFNAVKLSKELTVTEEGEPYTTTMTEWYAEGVGLVKQQSGYMNRDLVSYAVNPVEPSDFQISGNPGSFSNLQEALDTATDGNEIQLKNTTVQGPVSLGNAVNITMSGGWNDTFDIVTGTTKIHGALTLEKGSMIVANLQIY